MLVCAGAVIELTTRIRRCGYQCSVAVGRTMWNPITYHLSLLYKEKLPVVLCRSGAELPSDVSQLQHFYPIIVMHGAELVIRYLYCN